MMGRMWPLLLVLACTPKQAPASATAPISTEQQAFEQLSEQLHARRQDAPKVYDAASALAARMAVEAADPRVRADALRLLAALRDHHSADPPQGGRDAPAPLEDPAGVRADARATTLVLAYRVERAREALRRGDYAAAVDALEPLQGEPGWQEDAQPYWEEAADGYVAAERERLGGLYLEARKSERSQRIAGLREVQAGLIDLLERFPDSPYRDSLEESLGRVDRELDGVSP